MVTLSFAQVLSLASAYWSINFRSCQVWIYICLLSSWIVSPSWFTYRDETWVTSTQSCYSWHHTHTRIHHSSWTLSIFSGISSGDWQRESWLFLLLCVFCFLAVVAAFWYKYTVKHYFSSVLLSLFHHFTSTLWKWCVCLYNYTGFVLGLIAFCC